MAIAVGFVTAVWLAAVSRWIVRDAVVPWDSKNRFYAFFRFLSATLRAGEWPFWNPYHYGGHPSVADPQSLVFAPVFVAWGMLDPAPTMRAFDLIIFAHLLAGGIAIAIMGWRARWPIPSSVLAAALFMFGGAASGRLQHSGIILSYSLFPVALLLLQLALERRSLSSAIGFAIMTAGVALGRNQTALLLCVLLVAAALAEILGSTQPVRYLRGRSSVLTTMAVAGSALLTVPMLLTLQFAQLSNRPAESLDDALRGSLYPANLATLMVANIFGTHGSYWGPGAVTLPEVALTDDSENYLFVGVVPILLLLWFGIVGGGVWRRGRRLQPKYNPHLWSSHLRVAFPHLPVNETRTTLFKYAGDVATLRNRISHHEPIFKRDLLLDFGELMKLLAWICPDTGAWIRPHCQVPTLMRSKP